MRPQRFFFHYNRQHDDITVHWRGACHRVSDLQVHVPCETKWNSTQPRLVIQGWASSFDIRDGVGYLL